MLPASLKQFSKFGKRVLWDGGSKSLCVFISKELEISDNTEIMEIMTLYQTIRTSITFWTTPIAACSGVRYS